MSEQHIEDIPEAQRMDVANRMMSELLARKDAAAAPRGPVSGVAPTPQGQPAPEGVFTAADLLAFRLRSQEHGMPGGKTVWVHELAPESVTWLNTQAAIRVADVADQSQKLSEFNSWAKVFQVIACCRVGPEPNAAPCFTIRDADLLHRNMPWEVLEGIVKRCNTLSSNDEPLSEGLLLFFETIRSTLRGCASSLTKGSTDTCRKGLAQVDTSISRILSLGSLASGEAERLTQE